jgi:benzoate 4-monooxygenase
MSDTKGLFQAWLPKSASLTIVFAGSFGIALVYILYQRFFSPLAKVNGPFWASLSSGWKLLKMAEGDFHETIAKLHEEYGPIVRIAPNEVIISDKSAIREIYSTTQGKDFLKTDYYE